MPYSFIANTSEDRQAIREQGIRFTGMGAAIGLCWGIALAQASTFQLNPGNVLWLAIGIGVGVALGRRMNRRN